MDIKLTRANTDEVYDIEFVNGQLQTVTNIDEIGNRQLFGLSVYLGENPFNPSYGVDYFNNVFGKNISDPTVIDELKAGILGSRGTTGLKAFDLAEIPGTRTAQLTAQSETTDGQIDLTTTINI